MKNQFQVWQIQSGVNFNCGQKVVFIFFFRIIDEHLYLETCTRSEKSHIKFSVNIYPFWHIWLKDLLCRSAIFYFLSLKDKNRHHELSQKRRDTRSWSGKVHGRTWGCNLGFCFGCFASYQMLQLIYHHFVVWILSRYKAWLMLKLFKFFFKKIEKRFQVQGFMEKKLSYRKCCSVRRSIYT